MSTTSPTPEPAELLRRAEQAASSAGSLLLETRPDEREVSGTKSSATDIVTERDTAAERLLREMLIPAGSPDAFLGEESGEHAGSGPVRWVVDPLDGTVNYLYDLPGWSVSVAAEVDGVVVAGVVAVPTLAQTFTAIRGGGARLNGRPIRASSESELAQALVATGFGYDPEQRARQGAAVAQLLPRVRDIRRMGAAANDLCAVAAGRVDAYFERGLNPWDYAAGGLIAQEAGALVTVDGDRVVASGAALAAAFHELLTEVGG